VVKDIPNPRSILGWDIEYIQSESLLAFLDYCLFRRFNDFIADKENPVILDCGANIGYTVLNYKRHYPNSEIMAFEPDPPCLPILRRNLARNGAHVRVIGSAVWTNNGVVDWLSSGSDGSRIAPTASARQGTVTVSAVDLRDYRLDLHRPFAHLDRYCWTISIPEFSSSANANENPSKSKLFLFEDGRLLGPEHAGHDDICRTGLGSYSCWISCLYFSTSDNSDPNTNGRCDTALVPG
jgi:FkbM family methyltransferase